MTYEEKVRWLRRYQESLRREQELAEEVERLQSEATRITPLLSGMPGGAGDGQKLPRSVERIVQAKQELEKEIIECNVIRWEVTKAINQIDNPRNNIIFRKRYLLGKTFDAIAIEMDMDSRWIRKLHKKAIATLALNPL